MKGITYFSGSLRTTLGTHPHAFDVNPRIIERPLVPIAKTSRGEWVGKNIEMIGRECVRRREYPPRTAYSSEFSQTLSESGTGGIEIIESLIWLQRGVKGIDVATRLIQIVDEPHQITALKVRHTFLILFFMKYVVNLSVKLG